MFFTIPDPTDPRWEADANPAAAYLGALVEYVYPTPSPGLKVRLIILLTFAGL